jgi:hypothetical protein
LAGETEVFGEKLPQYHFVHHKSHMTSPGMNLGCHGGKSATNRLTYGMAFSKSTLQYYKNCMRFQAFAMATCFNTVKTWYTTIS